MDPIGPQQGPSASLLYLLGYIVEKVSVLLPMYIVRHPSLSHPLTVPALIMSSS